MQHDLIGTARHTESALLAAEIQHTCDQIKSLILQREIGLSSIPSDFEAKKISAPGLFSISNLRTLVIRSLEYKSLVHQ